MGDLALARTIWPLLMAAFLSQLPITGSTIFLLAMSQTAGSEVAVIGSLRGLGGLAALVAGVLAAPLIDRLPRAWSVAVGLVGLGGAALLAAVGQVWAFAAFFLLAGAASALLLPAIQAAGADDRPGPLGLRAATMIAGFPSLAGLLAAPLLAFPSELIGWQRVYAAICAAFLLLALVAIRTLSKAPPPDVARPGYLAAFQVVGRVPALIGLLLAQMLRAGLFAAAFTYLATYLVERYTLEVPAIALVISSCSLAFLLGNNLAGRLGSRSFSASPSRRGTVRLLVVSLAVSVSAVPAVFLVQSLGAVVLLLMAFTGSGGSFMAALIGLVVQRFPRHRGAVMGLNIAGINLGTFGGASLGGLGLAVGGYLGLAAVLAGVGLIALLLALWSVRALPAAGLEGVQR
jgi:predicted MFS family arabinose efflux permease